MKLAIVGSRTFNDYEFMKQKIDEFVVQYGKPDVVISGGAMGADKLGEYWAHKNHIDIERFCPEYNNATMIAKYGKIKWGKIAPIFRNKTIAKTCDYMIAFSVNNSNGTCDVTEYAKSIKKEVFVHEYAII